MKRGFFLRSSWQVKIINLGSSRYECKRIGVFRRSTTDLEAWKDLAVSVFSMEVIKKSDEDAFYLRLMIGTTDSITSRYRLGVVWVGKSRTRRA